MTTDEKHAKQKEQFKINVNNIIVLLLNQKTLFFNERSATNEAVNLIRDRFGISERQAQRYLYAARKEILKITEQQKQDAIKEAFSKGNLEILP